MACARHSACGQNRWCSEHLCAPCSTWGVSPFAASGGKRLPPSCCGSYLEICPRFQHDNISELSCYARRYPDLLGSPTAAGRASAGFCAGSISRCNWHGLLDHWVRNGLRGGREFGCSPPSQSARNQTLPRTAPPARNSPSLPANVSDLRCYAQLYPDMLQQYCRGDLKNCRWTMLWQHWVQFGKKEGRFFGCDVSELRCYAERYADLLGETALPGAAGFCHGKLDQCNWNAVWHHWNEHGKQQGREFGCVVKPHHTVLCSMFVLRYEQPAYILEWVAYHKLLGVDHFMLYWDDRRESWAKGAQLLKMLNGSSVITLHAFSEQNLGGQENIAKHCHASAAAMAHWVGIWDMDEFLVEGSGLSKTHPVRPFNLPEFLEQLQASRPAAKLLPSSAIDGVMIPRAMLNAASQSRAPLHKLQIEAYTNRNCSLNPSGKHLLRTASLRVKGCGAHHLMGPIENVVMPDLSAPRLRPNGCIGGSAPMHHQPESTTMLRLNHYYIRSQQECELKRFDQGHGISALAGTARQWRALAVNSDYCFRSFSCRTADYAAAKMAPRVRHEVEVLFGKRGKRYLSQRLIDPLHDAVPSSTTHIVVGNLSSAHELRCYAQRYPELFGRPGAHGVPGSGLCRGRLSSCDLDSLHNHWVFVGRQSGHVFGCGQHWHAVNAKTLVQSVFHAGAAVVIVLALLSILIFGWPVRILNGVWTTSSPD